MTKPTKKPQKNDAPKPSQSATDDSLQQILNTNRQILSATSDTLDVAIRVEKTHNKILEILLKILKIISAKPHPPP